eukprot:704244_1
MQKPTRKISEGERARRNKTHNLYKNGRLTPNAKKKLGKILEREESKGSLLAKFEQHQKKQIPKLRYSPHISRDSGRRSRTASSRPSMVTTGTQVSGRTISVSGRSAVNKEIGEKTNVEKDSDVQIDLGESTDRDPTASLIFGRPQSPSSDDTPRRTEKLDERNSVTNQDGSKLNWISIINYTQKEAEADAQEQKDLEDTAQKEFKVQLESQIDANKIKEEEDFRAKLKENDDEQMKFNQWKLKEDAKQDRLRQKMFDLRDTRVDQIKELEARRQREIEKAFRREQKHVKALRADLRRERQRRKDKIVENRSKMRLVFEENERQRQIRLLEKQKEEEEAVMLQKQYAKLLEKQERARQEAFDRIYARQNKNIESLLAATTTMREQAEADERRAQKEQEEYDRRKEEEELRKKERLAHENQLIKESMKQQIAEKEKIRKEEIAADYVYGQTILKNADKFHQENLEKERVRREKLVVQAKFLEEQIAASGSRKRAERAEMSETEMKYNKNFLEKVRSGAPNRQKIEIDPKAPFRWKTQNRQCPF